MNSDSAKAAHRRIMSRGPCPMSTKCPHGLPWASYCRDCEGVPDARDDARSVDGPPLLAHELQAAGEPGCLFDRH